MASPTPNKGYTYPAHGGAVNAWDTPLNTDFDYIDLNVGGCYNITLNSSIAGATFNSTNATISSSMTSATLPSSLAQNFFYNISGAITSSLSLVFPAAGGLYAIRNNSSGSVGITAITASSIAVGYVVPRGGVSFALTDGITMYTDSNKPDIPVLYSQIQTQAATTLLGNPSSAVAVPAAITVGSGLTLQSSNSTISAAVGFNMATNLGLAASRTGGNLLTVALKAADGTDATAANPVSVLFQTLSGTNTTGVPTTVNVTTALSIDTNALGASLGSINNTPFRFWIALFNNAGTPVLALMNASTGTAIFPVPEYGVASTVSMTGGATSAGVWYTPNGTTITSKAFRLIGYLEYTTGLATAGTYLAAPDNVVLFGPGIKKPGDVVQTVYSTTTTTTTINSTTNTATALTATITPTSAINPVKISALGQAHCTSSAGGRILMMQLYRNTGTTAIGNISTANTLAPGTVSGEGSFPTTNFVFDTPRTTASTQYGLYGKNSSGTDSWIWLATTQSVGTNSGIMIVEEIMG